MKRILIALILLLAMSSAAIAEGDQAYGMMGGDYAACMDMPCRHEEMPYTDVSAASASTATTTSALEEWAYGRRNMCPDGIEHVCWDFEEGSNLHPLKNMHPDIAVFENTSNSRCCFPACSNINEPSYVRKCSNCGPRCRCIMHIYPCATKFPNGTEMPYISALTGNAAFSPRVEVGAMRCYYPACSAFIGFKEDTQFVSFLASTHGTLYVRLYDHKGNYLSGANIRVNTKRDGDAPPNFTRFSIHLPDKEIGFMTLSGPFNGWNIDDLIVGGEFGYLGLRRDYSYAAERMESLIGAPWNEFAIGFNLISRMFYTADQIKYEDLPYYDPYTGMEYGTGIYDQNAIVWAFNENDGVTEHIVNKYDINKLEKFDFTEEIAYADIQPGDVGFIDYPPADGQYDEVFIVVEPVYDPVLETDMDIIRVLESGGVQRSSSEFINSLYDTVDGFVDYRSLPDAPKGSKCPYPKPKGKPI